MAADGSRTVRVLRPPVNENLVERLKEWTARAERGELIGAVLVGNMPGDQVMYAWSGEIPLGVAMVGFEAVKLEIMGVVRQPG